MKNIFQIIIFCILIILSISCNKQKEAKKTLSESYLNTKKEEIQSNKPREISILFIGDIMQHLTQIEAAYDTLIDDYDFSSQFENIKPLIEKNDITIASLEVSFGGPPYSGYPEFSCPDNLISAIKSSGIKFLVTANNHVCDNGQKGLEHTIDVIDTAQITRTGIFKNNEDKKKNHPMMIYENGFKIALLNYTYSTNWIDVNTPNIVNYIDKEQIKTDLTSVKDSSADAIIVYMHWGKEYERIQNENQEQIANLCFDYGADLVIGSHPHVIQPFKLLTKDNSKKLLAYSLGNFVSNYGTRRYCDGGALLEVKLRKTKDSKAEIEEAGYFLIWVLKKYINNNLIFNVLPVSQFEKDFPYSMDKYYQMKTFIEDSRTLMKENNVNLSEYIYNTDSCKWYLEK